MCVLVFICVFVLVCLRACVFYVYAGTYAGIVSGGWPRFAFAYYTYTYGKSVNGNSIKFEFLLYVCILRWSGIIIFRFLIYLSMGKMAIIMQLKHCLLDHQRF